MLQKQKKTFSTNLIKGFRGMFVVSNNLCLLYIDINLFSFFRVKLSFATNENMKNISSILQKLIQ